MRIELEKFSIENGDNGFQINLNPKVEIPNFLYKYYYLNKNSLDVLKNETLHFSHSFTMNDLMDGSFMLWDMNNFLDQYMLEKNIPKDFKMKCHKALLRKFSDEFLKYIGIFCVCENYSNDLFWTHYTNESGYCVEINTQLLLDSLKQYQSYFFPINYGELNQINFLEYCRTRINNGQEIYDANIPIYYSLSNKENFWNYENEWRLIIRNERFEKITNPQIMISEEQKNFENESLKKRNIKISKSVIEKIILATVFFNNKRFESCEFDNMKVKYFFVLNEDKKNLQEFLETIKLKFNDRVFQIDKYLKDGKVMRDIQYKVEILNINDSYVEIERTTI